MTRFFMLFMAIAFIFPSCKGKRESKRNVVYTCPMHPQVRQNEPGKCPICNMDLVLESTLEDPNSIMLSNEEIALAGIRTLRISKADGGEEYNLSGVTAFDQREMSTISARFPGRIDKLNVKSPGEFLQKGKVLFFIFSEDALSALAEYQMAMRTSDTARNNRQKILDLGDAARKRLIRWHISPESIKKAGKGFEHELPVISNVSGLLTDVRVKEGQYVKEGDVLFELAKPSRIWVEVQLFTNESQLDLGDVAEVSFDEDPGKTYSAHLIQKELVQKVSQQIVIARYALDAKEQTFRPGMLVHVSVNKNTTGHLILPTSAFLPDKADMVWVRNKKGAFQMKKVTTGKRSTKAIEVKTGLKEGDEVVISGVYLLNSAFTLKRGANTMEGMEGMKM